MAKLDSSARLNIGRTLSYLWVGLLALSCSCAINHWTNSGEREAYASIIEHSKSFQRAKAIDSSRVIWFFDQTNAPPEIYIGFDMGTHTVRFATLRIQNGLAQRQEMRDDGELVWIIDQ